MYQRIPFIALFLSLVLLAGSSTVVGQTGGLSGIVSTESNKPLTGADVSLLERVSEVDVARDATDREGYFEFQQVAAGAYDIVVRFVGFDDARLPVTIPADSSVAVYVRMEQTNVLMDPVVITASRGPEKALDAPSSVSVLTTNELQLDAVSAPAVALRNVAGVDVVQQGINHFFLAVRGFNDNYISRVHPLIDYRPMRGAGFSDAFYLAMPIQSLDLARIEVVRGPGSALYGPGVDQGVVHFITKDPFDYPGTSFLAEVGQQQVARGAFRHAGVAGGRFGYKLVGNYFRGEDWKFDPDDPHDAEILDAVAEELIDLNGSVVGPLGGRMYDVYSMYLGGEGQYRFDNQTTLIGNLAYSSSKNSWNGGGEWQFDGGGTAFGQIRLQSGRLFSQAFFSATMSDETYFNYRTGLLGYNKSSEIGLEAQYGLDLLDEREDLTAGIDFQRAVPRSKGTIMGRNEEDDTFFTAGGYLQSKTRVSEVVDLTLSGRVDYFSPTGDFLLSPRGALLFKPAPEHSLRLTYNRASGLMRGLGYFMDLLTDDQDVFVVRLRGGASEYTFSDQLTTSSFIALPGLPTQDPGVGISLQRAYAAATAGLTAPGGPLATSDDLQNFLWSRMAQIEGFSDGLLLLGEQIVSRLRDQSLIKPAITNTIEIGYKGLLADRVLLGLDTYYTKKKRFNGTPFITPFVLVPTLGQDLSAAVSATFSDEELSTYGLDGETLTQLYAGAGASLAENPVGLVEPEENFDPGTRPELLVIFGNFGEVDYFGIDVSIEAAITKGLTGFVNTSWISDNYFDEEELQEPGSGFIVAMNTPQNKLRLGLDYSEPGGLNARGSIRYVRSFRVVDDPPFYDGLVDAYTVVDLGAGYDLSSSVPGLRLDVTALNVLNNRHREYIGIPTVGRMITARVTYSL